MISSLDTFTHSSLTASSIMLNSLFSLDIRVISGPYFPVFGLNTEIYAYSVRIQENTAQK